MRLKERALGQMPKVNAQGFAEARLDTWKSIAQYLGRSTRTVQRWHSEYRLPVRHLGGDATSVFAYTDELDEWLRNRNPTEAQDDSDQQPSRETPEYSHPTPFPVAQLRNPVDLRGTSVPNQRRASELVELAQQMWESLCDANICSIIRLYREAGDLDPWNAKAFASLSQAFIAAGVLGVLHTSDAYRSAEAALRRALELDSGLIETRCSTGWIKLLVARDNFAAGIFFDEVLVDRPASTQALVGRALVSLADGELTHASELLRRASIQCPLNTSAIAMLCWQQYLAGDFENALAFVSQARASGHAGAILDAVEALAGVLLRGPAANVEPLSLLLAQSPHHYAQLGVLGYACGKSGQAEKALAIVDSMTVLGLRGKCDYAYSMALTFLGLDQPKAAMEWLEQSCSQGSLWSLGFQLDPILAPLRQDSQTRAVFGKMGCLATSTRS